MMVKIEQIKPFALDQDATYFFHPEKDDDKSDSYTATVPMDIWKKFELLPTPPRSPSRSPCDSPVHMISSSSVADTLQIVSEILDDDEAQSTPTVEKNCSSLKSKLIQDCMWNGSAYETFTDLRQLVTHPSEDLYETPCSTPPPVEYISSDCVDPSTVFPYPMNDTQSFCSSHSSDSEEEIDVVTIEKPTIKTKRKLNERPATTATKEEPPVKKLRPVAVRAKPVNQTTSHSKTKRHVSSGSEEEHDCESKRAVHNVLERKRRNDLKTSFHQLRAEVPELEENERSPKVTILRKARDYVEQLKEEETKLLAELDKEKERKKELMKRYSALKRN
ncbi:transcriptional regulator Myc-A isoform X2 [Nematostella vectensis]|nr:transcriptional regulator Myc-A isoform X2 [Nematostella vectensis]